MKIAVTSSNFAKIEAVNGVFSSMIDDKLEIVSHKVSSGISPTPMNDDEAILGCRNRIKGINYKKYDFIVSMEGLIQKYTYGCFVYGMAVILDCNFMRESIGCSAKVMVPSKISVKIIPTVRLSELMSSLYLSDKTQQDLEALGANGIITNGAFTRVDEFKSALRCALGFLLNEKNFL